MSYDKSLDSFRMMEITISNEAILEMLRCLLVNDVTMNLNLLSGVESD